MTTSTGIGSYRSAAQADAGEAGIGGGRQAVGNPIRGCGR
jgi:hypothetical protein